MENYLVSVWGKIRGRVKNRIYKGISSDWSEFDLALKLELIKIISNYTTLKELECGILNEQEIPIFMGGTIIRKKAKPIDRIIE